MRSLSFSFTTSVQFSCPVTDHAFVLRCLPATAEGQTVNTQLVLEPPAHYTVQHDNFGNRMAVGSIEDTHLGFSYRVTGTATVSGAPVKAPAHPLFRFESPLCHPSETMLLFLDALGLPERSDADTCQQLMHAVHTYLNYEPDTTNVSTTAAEAFAQKSGVCQDYAHVMISLLRAMNIPARYVSGLTLGEGATHAWVQAYFDGTWYGFDPTRDNEVDDRYLVMATGRDWSDCPVERGTFQGAADQMQTVFMQVNEQ